MPVMNQLSAFFRGQKSKMQTEYQEAEQAISSNNADNQQKIIDVLESVDFAHSRIPPQILSYKRNSKQPYGDLEYASRAVAALLRQTQNIEEDISKNIDENLYLLALQFRNAVSRGSVQAAFAAKDALVTCVREVRSRLAGIEPELRQSFLRSGEQYLNTWIMLVRLSAEADVRRYTVDAEKTKRDRLRRQLDNEKEKLFREFMENEQLLKAFMQISQQTAPADPGLWTEEQHTVRRLLIERNFAEFNFALSAKTLDTAENSLSAVRAQISALSDKVSQLPMPRDSHAVEKFNDEIQNFIQDLARLDVETDECLRIMDTLNEALNTLDHAPGMTHLRRMNEKTAAPIADRLYFSQQEQESDAG